MKRLFNFDLGDVSLIELADIFGTLWVVGLFLAFSPIRTTALLVEWKWPFLIVAILFAARPLSKMLMKEKSFKGKSTKKVKRKK